MSDDIVERLRASRIVRFHELDGAALDPETEKWVCVDCGVAVTYSDEKPDCPGFGGYLEWEAADEIERLRVELQASRQACHETMWQDTLVPLAEAAGVPMEGPDGNKRQFQMVEDLVAEIERLRSLVTAWTDAQDAPLEARPAQVIVTTTELEARRGEIIATLGMTLEEFRQRHESGVMAPEEWDTWDELRRIDILLGK